MAQTAAQRRTLEDAMLAVFSELDDGTLHGLAALPARRRTPRPRGTGMTRHGRVTVRHEEPTELEPITRHDMLKAAAQNESNWAWNRTDIVERPASKHRHHN